MHKDVKRFFPKFTAQFEGRIPWMYQDIKGLVTVGLGCLIDPANTAQGLPWVHISDGHPASTGEIDREWITIKRAKGLAQKGHIAAAMLVSLKLTETGIDLLAQRRLELDERFLKSSFSDFEEWPADAQLGMLSMAWAMGCGFTAKFPKFAAACKSHDWATAAKECLIRTTNNPGLIPRNTANVKLFQTASTPSNLPPRILRGYP